MLLHQSYQLNKCYYFLRKFWLRNKIPLKLYSHYLNDVVGGHLPHFGTCVQDINGRNLQWWVAQWYINETCPESLPSSCVPSFETATASVTPTRHRHENRTRVKTKNDFILKSVLIDFCNHLGEKMNAWWFQLSKKRVCFAIYTTLTLKPLPLFSKFGDREGPELVRHNQLCFKQSLCEICRLKKSKSSEPFSLMCNKLCSAIAQNRLASHPNCMAKCERAKVFSFMSKYL